MYPIDFVRHSALANPTAPAVVDGERSCTYADLVARGDALAAALQEISGKPRPTVALLGPNSLEMLVALVAVHAGGAILVPLNGRNTQLELSAQIEHSNPDVVIVHKDYAERFDFPDKLILIADADPGDPRDAAAVELRYLGQRPEWRAELVDINGIKFTGGSSGVPKGVLQSFRCINTLVASVSLAFEFRSSDRYLCVAPMTHGAGALILPILAAGGCVVLCRDANPTHTLDLMSHQRITTTWVPPTLLYKLIDEQAAKPRDLTALTHLIWGGAPASPARLCEAQRVFGPVVECVFGQTEAPLVLAVARARDLATDHRLASVGLINPLVEVAILGGDGRRLSSNELGEICARGDLLMTGYLGMPEETARTIRDGWLHTGDVGFLDEEGFLYVKDRIRDLVITGGFNVYPNDVEAALAEHPAVSEVVAFGVPDVYWGERLEAVVEMRSGQSTTVEELIAHCKTRIGSVKTPKRIRVVETLPRNAVGKVVRGEARAAALGNADS